METETETTITETCWCVVPLLWFLYPYPWCGIWWSAVASKMGTALEETKTEAPLMWTIVILVNIIVLLRYTMILKSHGSIIVLSLCSNFWHSSNEIKIYCWWCLTDMGRNGDEGGQDLFKWYISVLSLIIIYYHQLISTCRSFLGHQN